MEAFIGSITLVGFNFAPRGYAFCSGQIISISENQALYALLGTSYGGDGRTTYGIPDLRGRVPLGAIDMGRGPGISIPIPRGMRIGTESTTLTQINMPNHTHLAEFKGTGGSSENPLAVNVDVDVDVEVAGKVEVSREDGQTDIASFDSKTYLATAVPPEVGKDKPERIYRSAEDGLGANPGFMHVKMVTEASATATATTTGSAGGITGGTVTNSLEGGGKAFDMHQPSLGINYVMAMQGIFPSRN